jgi:sugar lactone lactonase YvrE
MITAARDPKNLWVALLLIAMCFAPTSSVRAQEGPISFESEAWTKVNAQVLEYEGREAMIGFAYLEGVDFQDGVIEVDVYCENRTRSYPGIVFRMKSQSDYERFYLRPHRSPLYPDALQYTPVFNGIAGWQLYHGEGATAVEDIPTGEWVHVRMEIAGTQARVFIGDAARPSLEIHDLKHGVSNGHIGLFGPPDRSAYFSNFSYRHENNLSFIPPPAPDGPPGMIREWEIAGPKRLSEVDREKHPADQDLAGLEWQPVTSEPSGLVDLSRYFGRTGREPDCAFARVVLTSETDQVKRYLFGYSDEVHVFINGELVFHGMSGYRQRDPSFLGAVGLNDAVYLPLKAGDNELLFVLAEVFGGWGFMCGDGTAEYRHESVSQAWTTEDVFLIPETVAYDPGRKVLYVSNNDMYGRAAGGGGQFISKVSLDGTVDELQWAKGVYNPAGMALAGDKLVVAERRSIVEIDADTGEVLKRHQAPEAIFLNDLSVAGDGSVYISDSGGNAIFKFDGETFEKWLEGDEIERPNGVQIDGGKLIFGNNGDTRVKIVDLETKEIETLVDLGAGIIDGIEVDGRGNYLVSQWEGKLFRVTPAGETTKLLDTTITEINCANFAFAPDKGMIVIPTYMGNRITAYDIVH